MAKIYQVAFELAGKIAGSFNKSMLTASGHLDKLGGRIAALQRQSADIDNFRRLKQQVGATGAEFAAAERRVAELAAEIRNTDNPTKGLQRSFDAAKTKAGKLKAALADQRQELHRVRESLRSAGISTTNLVGQQEKLAQSAERARRAQEKLRTVISKQEQLRNRRADLQGQLVGAAGMALAMAAPIRAAMQFESAMSDVKKVVDFETPAQFREMGQDILKMSQRIPMAADGLAAIVAAAGQAGIARTELAAFAESAAKMGVAFDITADEAGTLMAKWRASMGLTQGRAVALADAINHLSNNMASNAAEVAEVVRRQGALAQANGLAEQQTAALASALIAGGAGPEIAATALKNLTLALSAGTAATGPQQEAFAALGLEAGAMAQMMQDDAQGAIMTVMEALREQPADTRGSLAQLLFGKESLGAIAPLMQNLDSLKSAFDMVGDATRYAGSMQAEYNERSKTTANAMQLMRNRVAALGINIGTALLPGLNAVLGVLGPIVSGVADLSARFPLLTQVISGVTIGLIALKVASIAGGYAWTFLADGALMVRKAVLLVQSGALLAKGQIIATTVATKAWAAAQWLINAAMTANPIGLIIAAVAALGLAAYAIIKHWDKVREFFAGLFDWWLDKLQAVIGFAGKVAGLLGLGGGGDAAPAATTAAGMQPVAAHAKGGIFSRPHLGLVAEAGPEAIVPLSDKARGLDVLHGAARALGAGGGGGGINLTFSPTINVGSGDAEAVKRGVRAGADEMVAKLKAAMQQERRLSYA